MAQGNMLLGMARGSVGDVTFARSARKQVSRARNRRPNNPRTLAQCKQRVLMKTAGLAYSMFAKNIADQTFEGAQNARENQQRFIKYNIDKLRNAESETDSLYAAKGDTEIPLNHYIMSKGILNGTWWFYDENNNCFKSPLSDFIEGITYRQFCELMGIPVGSQLTAVYVNVNSDNKIINVITARLILAPDDGDADKVMVKSVTGQSGHFEINNANSKNIGDWYFVDGETGTSIRTNGDDSYAGATLIVSHYDKKWRYSDTQLEFSVATGNNFDDAVDSWLRAGMSESEEYTRQAE